MRTVAAVMLGLLVLALATAAVLLAVLDPNDHKAMIEAWASEAIGHPVRIEGPIELTRSLTPTLVVNDLRISGTGEKGAAVSIARAELSVVLTSLLWGPLHLPRVAIDKAELDLPLQGGTASSGNGDAEVPRIDRLALSSVKIRYRRADGDSLDGMIESATLAPTADQTATSLEITGTLGGLPLKVSGTAGTMAALLAGGQGWPVDVDATLADGRLSVAGKLNLDAAQPGFGLDAKVDLPASAKLAEILQIPALPLQATATLQAGNGKVEVRTLKASLGKSDVQGDLTWQDGQRAKLTGKLTAKQIDLVELGSPGADAKQEADGDAVPNLPLPTPGRIAFDLDLDATVERLDLPGSKAKGVMATASARQGQVDLRVTQAKLGKGSWQGQYQAAGKGSSPEVTFKLDAQGLDLDDLFGKPDDGSKLPENVTVKTDLTGRGADLHAFLGTASGPIAITTGRAVIADAFANLLGRSLLTALIPNFGTSKGAHILCSVLDLEAKDGKARSTALVIDGKHVVVGGGGAIDLATGKIDFMLLPTAKEATLAPLVTPVHLGGTIADPQVVGDAATILGSAGHLLLGIVNPLSLAAPILHPARSGDLPCRDPAAFTSGQQGPVEAAGDTAVDAVKSVGQGIGSAIKDIGKGASELLDDVTGQ